MLKAVLFDLDNTLIDRDAAHAAWCCLQVKQHYGNADTGPLVAEMVRRDGGGYGNRLEYFRWIAATLALNCDEIALFAAHQRCIADFLVPNLAVRRLLDELRRSIPIGIVTNGGSVAQRAKLRAAQLHDAVDVTFVSEELGYEKPDRRIFAHAAVALGVFPHEVIFVGDDYARDVVGSRNAGMGCCWVRRGKRLPHGAEPPDLTVDSITELESAALLGRSWRSAAQAL